MLLTHWQQQHGMSMQPYNGAQTQHLCLISVIVLQVRRFSWLSITTIMGQPIRPITTMGRPITTICQPITTICQPIITMRQPIWPMTPTHWEKMPLLCQERIFLPMPWTQLWWVNKIFKEWWIAWWNRSDKHNKYWLETRQSLAALSRDVNKLKRLSVFSSSKMW